MFWTRYEELCARIGKYPNTVAKELNITSGTLTGWQKGSKPRPTTVRKICEYFAVPLEYFDEPDWDSYPNENPIASDTYLNFKIRTQTIENSEPGITKEYVGFPIIGEVAAGYEHVAYESWDNGIIDIPESWLHGKPKEEFFVLQVRGDSMYPHYQDGDLVLVLRQETADYSGQVVVALYDDEKATVKKVEFDHSGSWVRLAPVNQQYPSKTVRGEDLSHFHILGTPKKLIRNIE